MPQSLLSKQNYFALEDVPKHILGELVEFNSNYNCHWLFWAHSSEAI